MAFGRDFGKGRLVKNAGEQQVTRLIRQLHAGGESLNAIRARAEPLDRRLVPTKNAGYWQATAPAACSSPLGASRSRVTSPPGGCVGHVVCRAR